LLEECEALAAVAALPNRDLYEQIESLVSPWITLESLRQADSDIINDLLLRCRQIDRRLGGRQRFAVGTCAMVVFALVMAGTVLVGLWMTDRLRSPLLSWIEVRFSVVPWAMNHSKEIPWLFVAGIIVTLLTIYIVSRGAHC
jgi:hypothetical protein